MERFRDVTWWYWAASAGLLAVHLFWWWPAIALVIALTAVQTVHMAIRDGGLLGFGIELRAAYLAMLLAGLWPPLMVLHWVQLAGTTAKITVDYCLLGRVLSLMPWRCKEPLTAKSLARTFLARYGAGSSRGDVLRCS